MNFLCLFLIFIFSHAGYGQSIKCFDSDEVQKAFLVLKSTSADNSYYWKGFETQSAPIVMMTSVPNVYPVLNTSLDVLHKLGVKTALCSDATEHSAIIEQSIAMPENSIFEFYKPDDKRGNVISHLSAQLKKVVLFLSLSNLKNIPVDGYARVAIHEAFHAMYQFYGGFHFAFEDFLKFKRENAVLCSNTILKNELDEELRLLREIKNKWSVLSSKQIQELAVRALQIRNNSKDKFAKECYENFSFWERIEGTAHYVDIKVGVFLGLYPIEKIPMPDCLDSSKEMFYETGAAYSLILDRLFPESDWQAKVEEGASLSDILNEMFSEWLSIEVSEKDGCTIILSPPKNWILKKSELTQKNSFDFDIDCKGMEQKLNDLDSEKNMKEIGAVIGKFIKIVPGKLTKIKLEDNIKMRNGVLTDLVSSCSARDLNFLSYRLVSKSSEKYIYENKQLNRKLIFFKNPVAGLQPTRLVDPRPFLNGSFRNFSAMYNMYDLKFDKTVVSNFRSRVFKVLFDVSFPQQYISATMAALGKWNTAFGYQAFPSVYQIKNVDPSECYVTQTLCFRWKGSPVLAWSNLGGYSDASYDPLSGEVIGGIISISNEADGDLTPTSADLKTKVKNDELSLDDIAELYLSRSKMLKHKHPFPEDIIGSFMIHELGHFIGLAHNFAGSNGWVSRSAAKTAMDYLPFPAINFHSANVQEWDRWAIEARRKNQQMPIGFEFCSDDEGDQVILSLAGRFENPHCKKEDLGSPIRWALALAEKSPQGLLGDDETLSGLGKRFPILRHLGIFFFDKKPGAPGYEESLDYVCKNKTPLVELKFKQIFKGAELICSP